MGAIGGLLGFGGGVAGTNFSGPQGAGLMGTLNPQDLINSGLYTSGTMQAQQGLLSQLQSQNGLGNQNQVYGQLQGVANGQGPNPAQMQYQQNIQDLAKQQAGALASQKGISPALQARMIAQQGSAAMQNAAAAGATNQANQQLGAIGAAGNLANTMAGQQIGQTNANVGAAQGQLGIYQGAAANLNNARNSQQGSINSANAGMANTQMQGQQSMIGGLFNGAGAALGLAHGGMVPSYSSGGDVSGPQSIFGKFTSGQNNVAQPSAPLFQMGAAGNAGAQQLSAGMQQFGAGIGKAIKGKPAAPSVDTSSPLGDYVPGGNQIYQNDNIGGNLMNLHGTGGVDPTSEGYASQMLMQPGGLSEGGKVPAMVSPGEMYLSPDKVQKFAQGGTTPKELVKEGEKIKGKAAVPGDSQKNDVVKKGLEPGGVVVKRSVMNSKDKDEAAAKFVAAVLANKGKK